MIFNANSNSQNSRTEGSRAIYCKGVKYSALAVHVVKHYWQYYAVALRDEDVCQDTATFPSHTTCAEVLHFNAFHCQIISLGASRLMDSYTCFTYSLGGHINRSYLLCDTLS